MRAVATFILALIISALPARADVKVIDVLRAPAAHADRSETFVGIMAYGNGYWNLCPFPEDLAQLPPPTVEHPVCIDLRLRDRDEIDTRSEKYTGAIVAIKGSYWHRCLLEVRVREPEVAREECRDTGLNGFIGVESIAVRGYSADGLRTAEPASDDQREEISPQSEDGVAIDKLVQNFLTAVRAKDVNALALLYPREVRGFFRVGYGSPKTRIYWLVLSPEMAVLNESARRPGIGYRVFGKSSDRRAQLCFCRRDDCTGRWPHSISQMYDINVATPTVCHTVERLHGAWWLR